MRKKEVIRLRDILLEGRFGYKIGEHDSPAETLQARGWNFQSKIGYLGTGYYFYGDEQTAKEDAKYLNREASNIKKFDLSQYNLYRPENPEQFYDNIKQLTREIGLYASNKEELPEDDILLDIADAVVEDIGLPLGRQEVVDVVKEFIQDIQQRKQGDLLSNRLLKKLGYQGIDNTDTPLDNYGVGSIIFM